MTIFRGSLETFDRICGQTDDNTEAVMSKEQINMKRRGFVAKLFGAVAIPIVADAAPGGEADRKSVV